MIRQATTTPNKTIKQFKMNSNSVKMTAACDYCEDYDRVPRLAPRRCIGGYNDEYGVAHNTYDYVCEECEKEDEEEEVEEWFETCEKCSKLMGGKVFHDEDEFDGHPDRERGHDEGGQWWCAEHRGEEEEPALKEVAGQTCDMCGVVWNGCEFEAGRSMNSHHVGKKGDEKVMCDVCEDKWMSPKNIKQCVKHGECGGHCSEEDWVTEYLEELEWSESKIEKFMENLYE